MPFRPFQPTYDFKPSSLSAQARWLEGFERAAVLSSDELRATLELRISPQQVRASGIVMEVVEDDVHGEVHQAVYLFQGVRVALRTALREGPHYLMLSVDFAACVKTEQAPSEVVIGFLEAAGLDEPLRTWSNPGLDRQFEESRTARATPTLSTPRFGPEAGSRG